MKYFQKRGCIFFKSVVIYRSCSESGKNPGVAKFGIALEWGSRGPEFESQHSDHGKSKSLVTFGLLIFSLDRKIVRAGEEFLVLLL